MIFIGKLFYSVMWIFLFFNLFVPYNYPANIILYIAFSAMVLLHGFQALLLTHLLTRQEKAHDKLIIVRFFIFGFFEMLSLKKRQKSAKES